MVAEGLLEYVYDHSGRRTVVATEKGREVAAQAQIARRVSESVRRQVTRLGRRLYGRFASR